MKKTNSVSCMECKLTITEPKTEKQIREKLRALGWRSFGSGNMQCAKCEMKRQHAHCALQLQMQWTGDIKDMVSPHMVQ
jgi:hypothetical protein